MTVVMYYSHQKVLNWSVERWGRFSQKSIDFSSIKCSEFLLVSNERSGIFTFNKGINEF